MQAKINQKQEAIELRKQGFSYSEILRQVPVSKSTLSLWLKSVKLAKRQKQKLTDKKLAGMKRGWEARRNQRIEITKKIKDEARNEIGKLSDRELMLICASLYWGEGSKEKEGKYGCGIQFGNSDPLMIKTFLRWIVSGIKIQKDRVVFEIYIHENHKDRINEVKRFWSDCTNFPEESFNRVYFKKNKIGTNRRNINSDYHGLLRIVIKNSSSLNRKIQGWIEGINQYCEVV